MHVNRYFVILYILNCYLDQFFLMLKISVTGRCPSAMLHLIVCHKQTCRNGSWSYPSVFIHYLIWMHTWKTILETLNHWGLRPARRTQNIKTIVFFLFFCLILNTGLLKIRWKCCMRFWKRPTVLIKFGIVTSKLCMCASKITEYIPQQDGCSQTSWDKRHEMTGEKINTEVDLFF